MEYSKFIGEILKKHNLGDVCDITKIDIGFNNLVYSIGDKDILKICYNSTREQNIKNEVEFYKNTNFDFVPELVAYDLNKDSFPFVYMIQEKLQGFNLYTKWSDFDLTESENNYIELTDMPQYNYNILVFEVLNTAKWFGQYSSHEPYREILFNKSKILIKN